MKTIAPKDLSQPEFHQLLIGAIGPRPIAFASTVDAQGQVNLSPFSFFNVFSSNPPTLIFAPNLNRHREKKHSLLNVEEVPEVVINLVNFSMVEQTSLASGDYERGVNEFIKAGFTAISSEKVRPPRVSESPVSFECLVRKIIALGDGPGAANLVVCEVILAHLNDSIFDERGTIDPHRIDLVARMGGNWYCRAQGEALFQVARPQKGIGFEQLPASIKNSNILSANDLGRLASIETLPTQEEIKTYRQTNFIDTLMREATLENRYLPDLLHHRAHQLLRNNNPKEAWLVLLQSE